MKNIIYLHTHDTGRCISPYGYAVDTPHLAALSQDAALFRQAFDCCPTCSPARASLLTGQYPHQCGMTGLAHRGFKLNDASRHLASFLNAHGFETILAGVQHEVAGEATQIGYERSLQFHGDLPQTDVARQRMAIDEHNTESACDFLKEPHTRPFFLSLGLVSTHRCFPVTPDPEDNPDYMRAPAPIPDTPECRLDWARFATMVRVVDTCFGKVLDTLRETNLLDNSMIIVTSDHGPAFPGMKCCLTDAGCGIPLIIRIPEIANRFVTDSLVSHLDVFPTVCDWLGITPPDWLEGHSLIPMLQRQISDLRDCVFAELSFHAATEIMRSARTKRYRYVKRFDSFPKTILPNIDNGDIKDFQIKEANLAERPRGSEELLFDLYYDPAECHSVASQPEYSDVLKDMRNRLSQWMIQTSDPLATTGTITPPPEAFLDPQDSIAPTP